MRCVSMTCRRLTAFNHVLLAYCTQSLAIHVLHSINCCWRIAFIYLLLTYCIQSLVVGVLHSITCCWRVAFGRCVCNNFLTPHAPFKQAPAASASGVAGRGAGGAGRGGAGRGGAETPMSPVYCSSPVRPDSPRASNSRHHTKHALELVVNALRFN
jgi:hypothetical protein